MSKKSEIVNFRLSKEVMAELDDYALVNNMTRSDAMRFGICLVLQRARNTPSDTGAPQ